MCLKFTKENVRGLLQSPVYNVCHSNRNTLVTLIQPSESSPLFSLGNSTLCLNIFHLFIFFQLFYINPSFRFYFLISIVNPSLFFFSFLVVFLSSLLLSPHQCCYIYHALSIYHSPPFVTSLHFSCVQMQPPPLLPSPPPSPIF